jgi:hypothetical protein
MARTVQWEVKLSDLASSPLEKAAGLMGKSRDQAKTLEAALKDVEAQTARTAAVERERDSRGRFVGRGGGVGGGGGGGGGGDGVGGDGWLRRLGQGNVELAATVFIAKEAYEAIEKIAGAFVDIGEHIIEVNEAKERFTVLFDALGEGQSTGKQVIDMLDRMSPALGQTRAEIIPLAQQFEAMGKRTLPDLESALRAAASATALAGQGGAQAYVALEEKIQNAEESTGKIQLRTRALGATLAGVGLDAADVAKQMGISTEAFEAGLKAGTVAADDFGNALQKAITEKGAGPLEKLSSQMGFQVKHAKELWDKLFEGIDVTPFTDAIKDLVGLLDQGNESGKVLHDVFVGFFGDAAKGAGSLTEDLALLFLDMEIGAVNAYDDLIPVIAILRDLGEHAGAVAAGLAVAFTPALIGVGEAAAGVAVSAGEAAVSLGLMIGEAAVMAAPFVAAGAAVALLVDQVEKLMHELKGFTGGDFMRGLGDLGHLFGSTATPGHQVGSGPAPRGGGVGVAPAHAEGGTVMAPAPGEVFASVAPGEKIVPAGKTNFGGNGGGGGTTFKLEVHGLAIHAGSDAKGHEIAQLVTESLSIEFERLAGLAGAAPQAAA